MQIIIRPQNPIQTAIQLNTSKSISNRALVLQHVIKILQAGVEPKLYDISDADDTRIMQDALQSNKPVLNIKNAGTCLRFLTALFAAIPDKEITISGDERMMQRPLLPLVEALNQLGSNITFLQRHGFIPIHVSGRKLNGGTLLVNATQSSQYISALMLIAPLLSQPLTILFDKKPVSFPYILLTQNLINLFGGAAHQTANGITVNNIIKPRINSYTIEKDWSSAAFWYLAAALDKHAKIFLPGLSANSLQGDSVLHHLSPHFGIKSTIQHDGILLENQQPVLPEENSFNLINHPDLAPVLICTACALNLPYRFTGLETLQFKESNRLVALQTELKKTGCVFSGNSNELMIEKGIETLNENVVLHTYNDHRLAMAFAMLSLLQGKVAIDNLFVTEKSYLLFTKHLLQNNFVIFTA